jgi:hypothetical protein
MRAVQLARVAAQAEKIQLQQMARRQARRVVLGAGGAVFGLGLFCWVQVIVFFALERPIGPIWASLVLIGINLLAALILGGMAMSSAPSPVEQEAVQVRDQALQQMRQAATIGVVAAPVGRLVLRQVAGRLVGRRHARKLNWAALAARFLASRS